MLSEGKCPSRSETSLIPLMSSMVQRSKSCMTISDLETCQKRRFRKPKMGKRRSSPRVSLSAVPMLSDSLCVTSPLEVCHSPSASSTQADEQVVTSTWTSRESRDTESSATSSGTLPSSVYSEWVLSTWRESDYSPTLSPTSLL